MISQQEIEAQRLARELGGGWVGGFVPKIMLTVPEAQRLEAKLGNDMPEAVSDGGDRGGNGKNS